MSKVSKNILIIVWHPRTDSFCTALAEWYHEWAKDAGHLVRVIHLWEHQDLDRNLREGQNTSPETEEPIWTQWREAVKRADHLLFVFPTRRYTAPACLKGRFDRLLLPKFSHQYTWFMKWKKLLQWRTGSAVSTCGGPRFTYVVTLWHPWLKWIKRTLRFVWITPRRTKLFSKLAPGLRTQEEREAMIEKMRRYGERGW